VRVRVLGAAAGGGFPQWNCGCAQCRGVRERTFPGRPRTQAGLAVSVDGERWALLGCSPEIRAQLEACPALHPRAPRHTPIAAVALANGDLDHVLGLLSLREAQPLRLFATSSVRRGLVEWNAMLRTLERFPGQSTWTDLLPDAEVELTPGLTAVAVPVPGKLPLHLDGLVPPSPEDNVGLLVRDVARGRTLGWFPTVARATPELLRVLPECDVVCFDGTFWSEDELARTGAGERTAAEMAHWPLGGPDGSLEVLRGLSGRRLLVHVNNTNPVLRVDGPERAALRAAGVEVAEDGLEVEA
jgi:pyrroloquinoline quinone biosynthesis protein B